MITIYTSNHCTACKALKEYLTQKGVHYEIKDAIEHLAEFRQFGSTHVPVIVKGEKVLVGFDEETKADLDNLINEKEIS
jgi:glutaredoxin